MVVVLKEQSRFSQKSASPCFSIYLDLLKEVFFKTVFQGKTLFEGVYGDKEANNAGEYMSVDTKTGELMVYLDSDTVGGGFAFMKLSPN